MATTRLFRAALLLGLCLGLGACANRPRPVVEDFDSYETVKIGPVAYTTPEGVRHMRSGRGIAEHSVAQIPGAKMRVEVDLSPPRDLKFDSDAARRRFLDRLPEGQSSSVQYREDKDQRVVKVLAQGRERNGKELGGVLVLQRRGKVTSLLEVIGPREFSHEMNEFAERMAAALELPHK